MYMFGLHISGLFLFVAVVETTEINAGNDEVKLMTKCFSSLEVSSNSSDACRYGHMITLWL